MAKTTKTAKTAKTDDKATAEAKEQAAIAKAEASVSRHSHVRKGSVRRPKTAAEKTKWGNKLLCEINTLGLDGKPDGNRRVIATSDAFQVKHTEEVTKQLRKQRAKDRRAAAKAERDAAAAKGDKGDKLAEALEG